MILRQDLRQQAAVIFDFDGTVALGHGPVRAYADAIPAERLANSAAFAEQVEMALAELDDLTSDYRDGYHAVAELATAQGITPEALSQAYISYAVFCLKKKKTESTSLMERSVKYDI